MILYYISIQMNCLGGGGYRKLKERVLIYDELFEGEDVED